MSDNTLIRLARDTFEKTGNTEEGLKRLQPVGNEIIQFLVSDGDSFYVKIGEGQATLYEGKTEQQDIETIRGSENAFREIFEGRVRLVDSAWDGKIDARIYHGRTDLYYLISQLVKLTVPTLQPEYY